MTTNNTMKELSAERIESMINAINLSITDLCVQIEMANQHLGATYQYTWRVDALRDARALLEELKQKCTQVHDLEM